MVIYVFVEDDNGSLWFWDSKSGDNFQQTQTIAQPGMYIWPLLGVNYFVLYKQY